MSRKPEPQPQRTLVSIFPDLPAEKRADREISFQFERFATVLAELALNAKNGTPFTVAVRGDWGRGNTTLLRRTRLALDEADDAKRQPDQRRVKTVWFNAWKYPEADTVLAGLLGAMLSEMQASGMPDRLKLEIRNHRSGIMRWIAHTFLRLAPDIASGAAAAAGQSGALASIPVGAIAERLGTPLDAGKFNVIEQRRAFFDEFRPLFLELRGIWLSNWAKAVTGQASRGLDSEVDPGDGIIAIFLDDLDRCSETRVLDTLEAINLFFDVPGVCFYMGLDWGGLTALLKKRLEQRADEYLEKMFQITIDLPEVHVEHAKGFVRELVEDSSISTALGEDIDALVDVLPNRIPRHLKKFLNDLALRLRLLEETGHVRGAISVDGVSEKAKVDPAHMVSWFVLREELTHAEWDKLSETPGNLIQELRRRRDQWKDQAERRPPEDHDGAAGSWGAEGTTRRVRLLAAYAESFLGLKAAQRGTLEMLASSPRLDVSLFADATPRVAAARLQTRPIPDDWLTSEAVWTSFPPGSVVMGDESGDADERPLQPVKLTASFKMLKYPVTNLQYERYVHETRAQSPRHWKDGRCPEGKEFHPVVYVSWTDVAAFCVWWSNARTEEGAGQVKLPTEAQWEYVARGSGTRGRRYPWGDGPDPDREHANFHRQSGDTTPVDAYPAGATHEGVFDLAGNVFEWCRDSHGAYSGLPETDRFVDDPDKPWRVVRGGSFDSVPYGLRCAARDGIPPVFGYVGLGFRCVFSSAGEQ